MKIIYRVLGVLCTAGFVACGGDSTGSNGTDPDAGPATDVGSDMSENRDSGMDTGGSANDGGQGDTGTDADTGNLCGNGVLDGAEVCDGPTNRDGSTCTSLGLPDGKIGCNDTCDAVDHTTCAVCDDGICSDGETAESCVEDCGVKSIDAGKTHTCAVLADGSLWCWGASEGHNMGGTGDTKVPIRLPGHDDVEQVATGDHHTCFVDANAAAWCFGANGFGEAGPVDDHFVFPPVLVRNGVSKIATGANHTCAIANNNRELVCWGRGDYGQRGDGGFRLRDGDPAVASSARPVDVQAGGHISCHVLATGGVQCWGDNRHGVIYDPLSPGSDFVWQNRPRTIYDVPGLELTDVTVGTTHLCFNSERTDGTMPFLACIGGNGYGQLGTAPSLDDRAGAGFDGPWTHIAAGFGFTCGQDESTGTPQLGCWGDNYFGQLGDGSNDARYSPGPVSGIQTVTALAVGDGHACAILPDETARCWGRNREGQVGDGDDAWSVSIPSVPVGLGPAQGGDQ